jgi:hypothetical protein
MPFGISVHGTFYYDFLDKLVADQWYYVSLVHQSTLDNGEILFKFDYLSGMPEGSNVYLS